MGCPCEVCHSSDPRDRRYRSAGLLETAGALVTLYDGNASLKEEDVRAKLPEVAR